MFPFKVSIPIIENALILKITLILNDITAIILKQHIHSLQDGNLATSGITKV